MSHPSRGRVLLVAMVVCGLAFGGCLTLDPVVTANTNDSAVFESVSVSESWSSQRVRASASLATNPVGNVTQITVVAEDSTTFSVVNTDPGQTSVVLELPANRNATLVAADTVNGTTIEKLNVTASGNELP